MFRGCSRFIFDDSTREFSAFNSELCVERPILFSVIYYYDEGGDGWR